MPKKITEDTVDRIVELRDKRGWGWNQIGKELGIDRNTASRYYFLRKGKEPRVGQAELDVSKLAVHMASLYGVVAISAKDATGEMASLASAARRLLEDVVAAKDPKLLEEVVFRLDPIWLHLIESQPEEIGRDSAGERKSWLELLSRLYYTQNFVPREYKGRKPPYI